MLVLALLAVACGRFLQPPGPIPVESDATFAAHQIRQGFIVDRLSDGKTGELAPPGWIRWPGSPDFVLTRDEERLASLFVTAPATVDARLPAGSAGKVEPTWDEGAIRLTLRPVEGPAFTTDVFQRTATSGGWMTITRGIGNQLDMRGTFRSELRDSAGKSVGWLNVRISPYQRAPRIYDAHLPAGVSDALASAAVVALSSELDWIESHVPNVYRGERGGPLEQSVPIGR